MKLNLQDLVQATGAKLLQTQVSTFSGIGTDTRSDLRGKIFIALKGDQHDAHAYLQQAVQAGAEGLVVHKDLELSHFPKLTVLKVDDTLKALQDLAQFKRKSSKATFVGITGSNGKTTSKEFAAATIGTERRVHYSKGSFNNHWGVPFTILDTPEEAQVALVEMGMNHAGEITRLVEIADPDVVVCTMVGRAHIEHFGSLEKIAEAKEEIYIAANSKATAVFNLDNSFTEKMYQNHQSKFSRSLTFSRGKSADVQMEIESLGMQEILLRAELLGRKAQVRVPVFGAQNLTNLMVSAGLGLAVGLTPEQIFAGLEKCQSSWGRNQYVETASGAVILFDGYNANPDSMAALFASIPLLKTSGKKVAVLGEMLEMGDQAASLHVELGSVAAGLGLEVLAFFGPSWQAFKQGTELGGFKKKLVVSEAYEDSLANEIALMLGKGDIVLVKGSRGMKLEKFVLASNPINFSTKKD